ncbi:MAG: hypothetical protein E7Z87_08555 [Cyanobacteria bacterium SIG26]|nr:hypothetical protein [Cyanobacteria bacterium SIG26]
MSIKIPAINTSKINSRNLVRQVASNGFLPVIALEACVEAGRTYQAYKRGGFDEARERITEEFSGAVFWLGGVKGLNWLFEKIGQKINHLPNINVPTASDEVRNPLQNYLATERNVKNGAQILESTMAKFKFVKVISSVIVANTLIGLVLPRINQAITRSYHKNNPSNNLESNKQIVPQQLIATPTMDSFLAKTDLENDKKRNNKDISFGFNWLEIASKFENDRNWQLISTDVGTFSGRAISARNNDERVEILVRDVGSIYFYMFNMSNMNRWLNQIEQKGIGSRLDPVSAEFVTKYLENYLETCQDKKVGATQFAQEVLGKQQDLSDALKSKFTGDKIKIIKLEDFQKELKNLVPEAEYAKFEQIAIEMSKLQPQLQGKSNLTQGQVKDILDGGHINNPEFLKGFYQNRFGKSFMQKYEYVAQSELDTIKQDLINYVKSIIANAQKTKSSEITQELLRKASSHNLRMNALNWGAGFLVSAAFLSTFIPKIQYQITKWRTGSDEFPGTAEYRQEQAKSVA